MRLTLFGATGATGKLLLHQALRRGDQITAVVRNPGKLPQPTPAGLRVVVADVTDAAAIAPAISDSDAVITAVGAPGRAPSTIVRDSTTAIMAAMRKVGARRFVAVSGSMVDDTGDGPFFRYVGKPMTRRIFRGAYEDLRAAEDEIHRSDDVDWTIMRPPRLTDKPASGRYRTSIDRNLPRGFTISRSDLATSILTVLNDPRTRHRHVFVAS